jgi:hypothetical protein
MTLLPVAPILLMPFILIFFIAVFPLWLIAMIVLGLLRLIARAVFRQADHPLRRPIEKSFDWVKSFGGLIHYEGDRK